MNVVASKAFYCHEEMLRKCISSLFDYGRTQKGRTDANFERVMLMYRTHRVKLLQGNCMVIGNHISLEWVKQKDTMVFLRFFSTSHVF